MPMAVLTFPSRPASSVQALVLEGRWGQVCDLVRKGLSPSVMATPKFSVLEEFFRQAAKGLLPADMKQDEVFETLVLAAPNPSPTRLTPLSIACATGRAHWVQFLLDHGHCPRQKGDGHTPITALASLGISSPIRIDQLPQVPEYGMADQSLALAQQRCLDLVIDAGADINEPSRSGATALLLSCLAKNPMLGMFLLSRGANPDPSPAGSEKVFSMRPLEVAILSHCEVMVGALIDAGASVSVHPSVDIQGVDNLVDVAAGMGQQGVMQALEDRLGKGHPLFQKAWWVALEEGNRDTIDWYIRGRVDPYEAKRGDTHTSHVLARAGHYDLLSDFFRRGMTLDEPDREGNTAWDVLSVYHPHLYQKARSQWKGLPGNVVHAHFPQVSERTA